GARGEAPLKEAASELAEETKRKVMPIVVDTTKLDSIQAFIEASASALGGVEILVNSAARLGGSAPDDFDSVTDDLLVNDSVEKTLGYFRCAREAARHMKTAGWGRIVNIGGVTVRTPSAFSTPARNAAMVVMSKALANSLAPSGITVNVVHPGVPVTERMAERFRTQAAETGSTVEQIVQQQAARQPLRRLIDAAD